MFSLYPCVRSSSAVCVAAAQPWVVKGTVCLHWKREGHPASHRSYWIHFSFQQNKEIPVTESWLSTKVWMCLSSFLCTALHSSKFGLLLRNLSCPGRAENRAVDNCSSLLGIQVTYLAILGVSFPDHPLLLWKRDQTHPWSSHVALANSDLR